MGFRFTGTSRCWNSSAKLIVFFTNRPEELRKASAGGSGGGGTGGAGGASRVSKAGASVGALRRSRSSRSLERSLFYRVLKGKQMKTG